MSTPWHLQIFHPVRPTITISRQRHGFRDECRQDVESVITASGLHSDMAQTCNRYHIFRESNLCSVNAP